MRELNSRQNCFSLSYMLYTVEYRLLPRHLGEHILWSFAKRSEPLSALSETLPQILNLAEIGM